MNGKLSFIILLLLVAGGYYAYDPEMKELSALVDRVQGKTPAAESNRAAKPSAKKTKAKKKVTPPAAEAPAPEAAPEPAAAPEPEKPAGTQLAPAGSARVAEVLAGLSLVNEVTPNSEARYYIYLMSAGWCGPCNQEMPNVVSSYADIKASGVAEIILIDFDDSPENARAYMNKYGATFPAIMKDHAPALPGIQPPGGIPSAILVDEMGNMVVSGHGSLISQWRQHITAYEEKNGLPSSFADEAATTESAEPAAEEQAADTQKGKKAKPSRVVARSLTKVKWASGKPNQRAQYYIYLQSASWCGPCQQEMPHIAQEYQAMRKDGRVELLLVSFDQTEAAARDFLSTHKASFPMVLKGAKGVSGLVGYTEAQGIPNAIIVDASGKVIASGHGSIVKDWRKYTIDAAP